VRESDRDDLLAGLDGDPELGRAVEALPAALPVETLPVGGWERLRTAIAGELRAGATPGRELEVITGGRLNPAGAAGDVAALPGGSLVASARLPRAAAWGMGAALVLLVAGGGAFAAIQAGRVGQLRQEQTRLLEEQRVLASWMSNPEMVLVALQPAGRNASVAASDGSYSSSGAGRHGVVCVLPDGRGLVFQPNPAPKGQSYVVIGDGPAGEVELARGSGNMIRFEVGAINRVEVRLTSAGAQTTELLAWAQFQ